MIIIFFIFLLLVNISTKTIDPIDFNVETNFNKDKSTFSFDYDSYGPVLVYVIQKNNNSTITLECGKWGEEGGIMYTSGNIIKPGGGLVLGLGKGTCFLNITEEETSGQLEGNIWIYPLGKELYLDLTKKYEKPLTVCTEQSYLKPLIFSVSNLNKDIKIKFEYKATYKNEKFEVNDLSNPFKVCDAEKCEKNVNNYDFKKGKNYQINVDFGEKNIEKVGEKYNFLPGFTLSEMKDSSNAARVLNLSLISLVLLFLI